METQNVIKTLFEYTSNGYEEANKNATELLGKIAALRTQEKELEKAQKEAITTVDALNKKWQELNKTLGAGAPKELREYFASLPKLLEVATAAQAKATAQKEANIKAQDIENKKVKEATDIASTYKKVLDELGKGLDNAEVSTDALTKAKKYLNSEMAKTDVGTEKYKELSKEMAQVTKASNDIAASQRQQVKEIGVAENSVEALRLKVAALNKEWRSMDQNDPGFADKEAELAALTDQLIVAEEKVGIFSRSVGNYAKAAEGFVGMGNPLLKQIIGITQAAPGASAGIKALGTSVQGFGKQLLALLANPIVAIIAAIVGAFMLLKKAFEQNDAASDKLAVALAPLKGIFNLIGKAIQVVADIVANIVLAFSEAAMAVSKFFEKIPFVGAIFKEFNAEVEKSIQLEKDRQALEDAILATQVESAKNSRDIAKLRSQAAEKDKYTAQERLKFMQEAADLERQNADMALNIANEKLRIAQAEWDAGDRSQAQQEKLAQLQADAYKAQEEHYAAMQGINKKIAAFTQEIAADEKAKTDADKSAADKARQAQDKANADYIKAAQDRMKATEEVKKAEIAGDNEALAIYQKILVEREASLKKASKKRLILSQLEKDELELQEYQHQKALDDIQKDADKKRRDDAAKKADDYLKAVADTRIAQEALLEAQKRGNATEIALFERLLKQKKDALAKYNADEIQLNDEQRLTEEMAQFDHQQKIISDYIALQEQLAGLQKQYNDAQTQAERETIQRQIDLVNKKVAAQIGALNALGIEATTIQVNAVKSIDATQKYLTDRLEQSLQTIEQFSGKSKNNFFKLASSIGGLVAKAFDISKIRAKYGNDAKGIETANKEIKQSMIDLGAAVAINGLNAATDLINQNIEQEKAAIDEMYAYQEKRAQDSYDQQSRDLKAALDDKQMSESKYRLEQMKLDDKKAEEDKKRERDKANAMYDLELKQFRVNQAKDALSTIIATSLGIMQGYAQTGPISGSVFAAIVGALGAAQVGMIYAQKPPQKPKFEKGGGIRFEEIEGPSHKDGGVPIRFGNKVVAEAEGDEGALIVSKKAMKNPYMRKLLAFVESVGANISGTQTDPSMFAEGGYLSYDEDFFMPARNSLKITKRKKRSIRINGKKVKLKPYGWNADAAIDDYAEKIAIPKWNAYIDQERSKLEAREAEVNAAINAGISSSETLKSMGISDITTFNKVQADKQKELDTVQKQIKVYEEAANARIDALKAELQYEQKLADFEKQRKEAASELATATEEFNTRVLGELRETGQITEEEYLSMLDQIKHGYGVKTSDIINLKKKEVEAIKKLINEERDAELNAVKETAKYREDALAQIRSEWEENYNAITQQILDDVENASEAVSQLTGTDLERFNQILHIQQEIKKMEEDYAKTESLLTDGIITSREERAALVAEQKRIKEELALKEKEAEEAKAAFEAERQKNMETARKAYETENFEALLAQIKELGAELQAEGSKWTLDKELAAELDTQLQTINATYDEQIAKQDAIIDGLQAEIEAAQLLHDKKVAYIKEEEEALKATFEGQKAAIESWLADATAGLRTEAAELAQFVAALKVAGIEAGMTEYEKAMEALNKNIDSLESTGGKKYATGGAIELGSGLFQVAGPSHSQGGVPIRVGNTQIAEVEGIEKMFAVNKMAASDPEMMAALARASDVNARYTGVSLLDGGIGDGFALDYDLLAAKIGAQINMRPTKTFMTHRDVRSAYDITDMHKKASFMK